MFMSITEINNLTDLMLRYMAENKELCNLEEQMSASIVQIGQQTRMDRETLQLWSSIIKSVLDNRELTTETVNTIRQQFANQVGNAMYNWLHDITLYGEVVGKNCNLAGAYRSAAFEHGAHLIQML